MEREISLVVNGCLVNPLSDCSGHEHWAEFQNPLLTLNTKDGSTQIISCGLAVSCVARLLQFHNQLSLKTT